MTRINTNIASFQAINRLGASNRDLSVHLERLSTGLKINSASDGPAALIASETLRSEIAGIGAAIDNSERADSVIATAEGALNEVNALLVDIKGLITNSANEGAIANEEIKANQLQIDSAVDSISRIANTTVFEGVKLLNGSLGFTTSGVAASAVTDIRIDEVRFGTASTVNVTIDPSVAAERAELQWAGSAVTTATTIEVAGAKGVEVFSFAASATRSAIVSAINLAKDVTGVSAITGAAVVSTGAGVSGIVFNSIEYGSKQFVSVEARSGTFDTKRDTHTVVARRDTGVDISAAVNGVAAVADGLEIAVNGPSVWFTATLHEDLNDPAESTSFTITGGGAKFQLGPAVNAQQMSILGIQSVASHRLGNSTVGYLNQIKSDGVDSVIDKEFQDAGKIVDAAIQQVATMRGRLGAFQKNTLQTNINSLNVALENVTASESAIRDADFATETSALTRSQILVQAGTSVLSIANSQPQNVLALLG